MKFIEWPSRDQFIPLPGDMQVTKQTTEELVIEGRLPDGPRGTDRRLIARFTASDGVLHRLCRTSYRAKVKKKRWMGPDRDRVEYEGTRGSGGLRATHSYLGWLLQNWAT